jgi:hypothetical protein
MDEWLRNLFLIDGCKYILNASQYLKFAGEQKKGNIMKNNSDIKKRNFLTQNEIESLLNAANSGPHAADEWLRNLFLIDGCKYILNASQYLKFAGDKFRWHDPDSE